MYEWDEKQLVRYPAPEYPKWFTDKLREIGGYHVNGKPRLRVVWGCDAFHFACGGEKPVYSWGSKTEEKWLWGLREVGTNVTYAKSQEQVEQNADPNLFGVRKLLYRNVEWFGAPRWVIEYYIPADKTRGDRPSTWAANQYGWWFNPVTERREWTKIVKDFPADGDYRDLFVVKEDDGTRWGRYQLLSENVLNDVRAAIQRHEAFRKVNTDEELIQQMVDAQEAREDQAASEIADAVEQEIGNDWRRMLKDNPRVFQSVPDPQKLNKITNHGRAI